MCPSHRTLLTLVSLPMVLANLPAAILADSPTSQPAPMLAGGPASQPADAATSRLGAVRVALTQLYVVPRNAQAPMPGSARTAQKPSTRPAGPPAITIDRNARADRQGIASTTRPGETADADPPHDVRPASTLLIEPIPWTHRGTQISSKEREWADYRYYNGTPSRYGVEGYGEDGGTYRFGFMQGYDYGRFDAETDSRVQALMSHASVQIDRGVQYFQQGQYQQAADTFQLAAETDQGDAIARIYAGHALFALGRYRDSTRYIRRAFELQPRISYLTYDIRGDYANPALFEQQIEALRKALDLSPRDTDRLFLLGYLHYYTGQRTAAYRCFMRAVEVDKTDTISDRLMRNAQPPDVEVDQYTQQGPRGN